MRTLPLSVVRGLVVLLPALALGACKTSGTLGGDDADGDRYGIDEDCDDGDATVHPGGVEVCDGKDNDCNGEVDDGVGTTAYTDADGDGYGDPNAPVTTCEGSADGTVANADDCDDTDPAINPLGTETCNDKDDDCDGKPDWGVRVPADFARIGDAIGAAVDGATVCVAPGTYVENLDFDGRAVTVLGLGGSAATTIDGGGVGPVVSFDTKETPASVLQGFTITNGDDHAGSGMYLREASPTLVDVVITGNHCTSTTAACKGTGLYAESSSFTMTSSRIEGNDQTSQYAYYPANSGAGVYLESSSPTLEDVVIADNTQTITSTYYGTNAGAGLYVSGGSPSFTDVTISGNVATGPDSSTYSYGGGAYLYVAGGHFLRTVIAGNVAEGYAGEGGGLFLYYYGSLTLEDVAISGNVAGDAKSTTGLGGGLVSDYGTPTLLNVDVVGNRANGATAAGGGLFLTYYGSLTARNTSVVGNDVAGAAASGGAVAVDKNYPYTTDVAWSNFYDNGDDPFANVSDPTGQNGNISANPAYGSTSGSDPAAWDLTLASSSPLVDAGDPDVTDADGSRSDIGSHGGPNGR